MFETQETEDLYSNALKAEEQGDNSKAFDLFMQGAILGDDAAQNAIGLAYDSGTGITKNKEEAITWFKKAWHTGKQVGYCENIALTYAELGYRRRAIYWWKKAIALGDGSAALAFAKFLLRSNGNRATKQIFELLRMSIESQESWQISVAEREEAQLLTDELISLS